jgi:hypothetical protein
MKNRRAVMLALVLWGTSCGGGSGTSNTTSAICAGGAAPVPGPAPLRRLTRFEYGRTVHDLVGADPTVANALPPDEESLGFDDQADAYSVSTLHAQKYLEVAEQLAAALAAAPSRMTAFAGCDPTGGDAACVDAFVRGFGRAAWRRPVEDDEAQAMEALYGATASPGPGDGVQAVVTAMLQAPQFLYRPEAVVPAGSPPAPLDDYALATRLSYMIVGSAPDATMLDDAASGMLQTQDGLLAEADRLLADPRSTDVFIHFMTEWWELETLPTIEKDRTLYRTWTDAMPAAFATETNSFLTDAWQNGPTITALFTTPATFVDADLAAFYGLAPPAGDGFQRVDLDPARGAGMFTQGSFLAVHAKADQTSPVQRGKFVRARLFCAPPPQPPPNIVVAPPTVDPRLSTRERFAQHTADPECSGCHSYMDPVGFAFEHYDATGRWRDIDGGMPVDSSGMLDRTDVDGPLTGVADLAQRLTGSAEVRSCVATQWFRYAFGRSEQDVDACTIAMLANTLTQSGGDMRAMVRATVTQPAFRSRLPEDQQ